jgi:hypothetical protein
VGHLDQRPASRHEHRDRPHHDASAGEARAQRPPRERPPEKPIAKAVHDGFDFNKPYEPGNGEAPIAVTPTAPPRRGNARPVAALLGGFSPPRK